MLLDIIKILENIVMLTLPFYAIYMVLKAVVSIDKHTNTFKGIKFLICSFLTIFIAINIMIFSVINIYTFAVSIGGKEIDLVTKELGFLSIISVLNTIGIVVIYLLWENIVNKQLISGSGTIKERIKQHWREFKNVRRKENIGNNNS